MAQDLISPEDHQSVGVIVQEVDISAAETLDRCEGLEMDAVAVNEEGIPYFFKGDHLFKGFHGKAELSNGSFAELDDHHHLGHVDAAFRMHYENSTDHDHMYFFLDNKVFSYFQHKLEEDNPKDISEVFPGIPDHLDAAVECPKSECGEDSVIFFKGDDIFHFNVKTKAVDMKEYKSMPNCTSAFRFLENYYCFHGEMFSKFDPKTGDVHGRYPKEARDFFMRCPRFSMDFSNHTEREQCSHVHLDAIAADMDGNVFSFRGHHFVHMKGNQSVEGDTIENAFKELHSEVNAVFIYDKHIYMMKGDGVFVYKIGEPHTHLEGYPKPMMVELGIEGPVDAAFVMGKSDVAHVIKGQTMYDVDMMATPRVATNERVIPIVTKVDAAMYHDGGLVIVVGNHLYRFDSPEALVAAPVLPEQHLVTELLGCNH
uniref:hemopexin n=1 Tax=Semicossyphus pulcher TaxID=241346 RepID=UPI0037E6FD9E